MDWGATPFRWVSRSASTLRFWWILVDSGGFWMKCLLLTLLVHDRPEDHNYRYGLVSFSSLAANTTQNLELSCCHSSSMILHALFDYLNSLFPCSKSVYQRCELWARQVKGWQCLCWKAHGTGPLWQGYLPLPLEWQEETVEPKISHIQKRSKHLQCAGAGQFPEFQNLWQFLGCS